MRRPDGLERRVAKALGGFGPQTRTGIIKGKLAYMAPEQVAQKVLPATDVFGAGIVLHELLTGRRLFGGSNEYLVVSRVLKAEIPRPSSLNPNIPKELDDVTMKALSRDLRGRFVDGNAMAEALSQVLGTVQSLAGTTNHTVRDWVKKLTVEAAQVAQGWEEQESGLHVDVQNALAHSVAKGEDVVELAPDDLLLESGQLDPGVKAAVTMGLRTLRPDMLKQAPVAKRPMSTDALRPPPLPGARAAANRVSTDAMPKGPRPPSTTPSSAAPAQSPARGLMPVIAPDPDPAASTMETVPTASSVPSIPSVPTIPGPADPEPAPALPPFLAGIEPKLPVVIRTALRDGQVLRLAMVIGVLVLVLVVLLLVALLR